MKLSRFGAKFTEESGILRLMDDLGEALSAGEKVLMLGGGNPARIPAMEAKFREHMRLAIDRGELEGLVGSYDSPQGHRRFLEALAGLLQRRYGWKVTASNIALTNGSQTTFFYLFNLLAGTAGDGRLRRILFPLTPEYIGYSDAGIEPGLFTASKPEIELLEPDLFKYHVDFDRLRVTNDIAAICVSRPTNPTSNVLTAEELERLRVLAAEQGIPLIVDNAYGTPFPDILFIEAEPVWDENVILTMSLSKLGLPGVRTGIVVAREEIVKAIASLNAVVSLAPSSFGAYLALDLVRSGEILELSRNVIRPFYERKSQQALAWVREHLSAIDYRVHKPEGTFFFWLWFPGLSISSGELYERLKARGVLIVPGHYFFPGLDEVWRHRQECLRLNYSQDDAVVERGIAILGDELRKIRR
ncbi:MAG TPA: valine--pyruvate transaminase [Vicinamibacteria bacterium]|nr:valine--pyruvate transaminase [Vicinamibacteria bacterium]